jgi:signal transduction histidine kinase
LEIFVSLPPKSPRIWRLLARQRDLKDLEQEVYRLIRLVNGLLFLVRLEQEEVEHYWQFSLINISDLLEILIEQFKELNLDKNIRYWYRVIKARKSYGVRV